MEFIRRRYGQRGDAALGRRRLALDGVAGRVVNTVRGHNALCVDDKALFFWIPDNPAVRYTEPLDTLQSIPRLNGFVGQYAYNNHVWYAISASAIHIIGNDNTVVAIPPRVALDREFPMVLVDATKLYFRNINRIYRYDTKTQRWDAWIHSATLPPVSRWCVVESDQGIVLDYKLRVSGSAFRPITDIMLL